MPEIMQISKNTKTILFSH